MDNQKAYLKQAYDTAKFFNKLCDMYGRLQLCDSVDLLPDARGKVKPHFRSRTHSLRMKHLRNMLSGGKFFLAKKNYAAAYPFFDNYCSLSADSSTTLWATVSAFMAENYAGTVKHADAAISYSDSTTAAVLQEYDEQHAQPAEKPARKAKAPSPFTEFIIDTPRSEAVLKRLHEIIDGKRPKVCALTILAAVQNGIHALVAQEGKRAGEL